MTSFEIRASNIVTAIEAAHMRISDFGYDDDPIEESISRINGMFITWLTSCEEARHQSNDSKASFVKSVIEKLPENDDPEWPTYIEPKLSCTLRQRTEAYWGIRIAYTHADGEINLISNRMNRAFAENVPNIFDGANIADGKLMVQGISSHVAIRTFVQLRDVLQ